MLLVKSWAYINLASRSDPFELFGEGFNEIWKHNNCEIGSMEGNRGVLKE